MARTACKFEKFTEAYKKILYLLLVFLSAIFNRAYVYYYNIRHEVFNELCIYMNKQTHAG